MSIFSPVELKANVPAALPRTKLPDSVAILVLPKEERVVKAALDGVVNPIAVLLIPVKVVLKFEEVVKKLPALILKLLTPVLIDEALSPERVNVPEVALRLIPPVVKVKPLDAVSNPADVIVPVPVVSMFPEVVKYPNSSIVNVAVPPFE